MPNQRCIGCGYYADELPESPFGCPGGDGYTSHVLVDVDESGMAIPTEQNAGAEERISAAAGERKKGGMT